MQHTSEQLPQPEEQLQYIRQIIADSRARFAQSGEPYIIWGLLIAVGMGITYLSILLQRDLYTGYVWIALILSGWVSMFVLYRKRKREEPRAKSVIDRIDSAVWTAGGSSSGLLVVMINVTDALNRYNAHFAAINPLYICFISAMLIGIAFFISGTVNQIPWLRNTAFAWWSGSVAMTVFGSSIHVLGLYALMLILFQVVPGIILQRRYHRIVAEAGQQA